MTEREIFVTRPSMPHFEEYVEQIRPLWQSRWITNIGDYHLQLEAELANKLRVQGLSLFTNGHLAIEGALQAAGLFGEVITTPFTFASTTHAIVRQGLTPVFCDVKESDGTIDETQIEQLITEKTTAILPVHVYGNCCNVQQIERIAKKHNLKVIYDAAHAFGVELGGKGIGAYGDFSIFSFHATKVFNTIEGGAVCFQDPQYKRALHQIRNFGIEGEESVVAVGGNAKMNEFQAAMGLCNLRHFAEDLEKRKVLYNAYLQRLKRLPGIRLLEQRENAVPNYAYLPILVDAEKFGIDRDSLYEKLRSQRIFVRKYFYPLVSDFECYKSQYAKIALPTAKKLASQVLTLPLYSDLSLEEVDMICGAVQACLQ